MKYSAAIIFVLLSLIACSRDSGENSSDSPNTSETTMENLNIQTKNFVEIDSTGILMFPLNMGENQRTNGSYSYKEMPKNGYWNILFLNSNTNEYHLLTEKKILLLEYDYEHGGQEGMNISAKTHHIFYTARTLDYNKDKLLNEIDPIYLFVSDKFGKNFRQISPNNYSLNSWKYIAANRKIILTAYKDSNKNNLFDEKDEVATFEVRLDKNETPRELFQEDIKNKLKMLYDRDWKKIR